MSPALLRLRSGASAHDLHLSDEAIERFDRYLAALLRWRTRLNLTAAESADEIVGVHFADSLLALLAWPFPHGARVVDVGSGAGFPGIPLKIARPDLAMTLVEASRRRVAFLEHARDVLEMPDIDVVWGRAEHLARHALLRERFTAAVERAAAPLAAAAELCVPFVTPGGAAVLLKGLHAVGELRRAEPLIAALGARVMAASSLSMVEGRATVVVVLEKSTTTPDGFPRAPARLGRVPIR
ncbi:MAG: 16S rRNA (guanine(527)-N(7))-methyltransferase RsmG [Armatimonadota bacterium]|nr:16S rRNA (guanine(527)-N(7))-methyltransferase RsmG [Armatimonadota bacterium]